METKRKHHKDPAKKPLEPYFLKQKDNYTKTVICAAGNATMSAHMNEITGDRSSSGVFIAENFRDNLIVPPLCSRKHVLRDWVVHPAAESFCPLQRLLRCYGSQ